MELIEVGLDDDDDENDEGSSKIAQLSSTETRIQIKL
jgi:hypothetical protein